MYFGAFLGWLKACNRNVPWDHICFHGRVSQHRFHLDYFKTFSSEMLTFTLYLNWALWQKKNHFVVWRVRFFSSISLLWNNQFCKLIVCKVYLPCFRTCTYLVFFLKVIKTQVSILLFAHLGIEVIYGQFKIRAFEACVCSGGWMNWSNQS